MSNKLSGLASRLRAGIEAAADAKERAEREAKAAEERAANALAAARAARAEMVAELYAFAVSIGHIEVVGSPPEGPLSLRYLGREIRFVVEGDGDRIAIVDGSGRAHHLTRDTLGEWEVAFDEPNGLRRLPVEYGLEELIAANLAIAVEPAAESPSPAPAAPVAPAKPVVAAAAPLPTAKTAAPAADDKPKKKKGPQVSPGSGVRELNNPWD